MGSAAEARGRVGRGWRSSSTPVLLSLWVAVGLLVAGCGQAVAPSLTATARPAGFHALTSSSAGVRLRVPLDWTATPGSGPLWEIISSGPALMALWRYTTRGRAPVGAAAAAAALVHLERAAAAADRTFHVLRAGVDSVDGAPTLILDATETISGQPRRVRSEHVLLNGSEIVLESYAPPAAFASDDHLVFSPVRKSLTLLGGSGSGVPSGAGAGAPTRTGAG